MCTPYTHGTTAQQVDGNDGIDNAFGAAIMPSLSGLGNLSQLFSQKIADGAFTFEIDTVGLDTTSTQTATGLAGQFFVGSAYGGMPPLAGSTFSRTDSWPVSPDSLRGSTIASGSTIAFPGAYVTGGIWVSGAPSKVVLSLDAVFGIPLKVSVYESLITFNRTVSSGQGLATHGILAGVVATADFVAALNELIAAQNNGSECSLASVVDETVKNASDLVVDPATGQVSNPAGVDCNAISIGIAFDADEIAPPTAVGAPTDGGVPTPCPDVDGGS